MNILMKQNITLRKYNIKEVIQEIYYICKDIILEIQGHRVQKILRLTYIILRHIIRHLFCDI